MSTFYINTNAVDGAAEDIKGIASELYGYCSEIAALAEQIGTGLGSYGPSIKKQLESYINELFSQQRTLDDLGDVLEKVVEAYKTTEQRVVDRANSIRVNVDINAGIKEDCSFSTSLASGVDTTICWKTKGREELLNTPDADMDALIEEFEKNHVMTGYLFDQFLSSGINNFINADDIRNIKYLAYTAPEPYRSIFLSHLEYYHIKDGDAKYSNGDPKACYTDYFGTDYLKYNYPGCFGSDPRGPYTTVFHECGHCIDDNADEASFWGWDTDQFEYDSKDLGKTNLYDLIIYDVYYNESNPHSVTSIIKDINAKGGLGAGADSEKVIKALQEGTTGTLTGLEADIFLNIKSTYTGITGTPGTPGLIKSDATFEAVSDVYGGVSDNVFSNGYYHNNDNGYWNDKKNPGKELWAEYFSYNMARDDKALQNLREFFPEASKLLDSYANSIKCGYE